MRTWASQLRPVVPVSANSEPSTARFVQPAMLSATLYALFEKTQLDTEQAVLPTNSTGVLWSALSRKWSSPRWICEQSRTSKPVAQSAPPTAIRTVSFE